MTPEWGEVPASVFSRNDLQWAVFFPRKHPEFFRGGQAIFLQIFRCPIGIFRVKFVKGAKHSGNIKPNSAIVRCFVLRDAHIQTVQRHAFSEVMYREGFFFLQRRLMWWEMRHKFSTSEPFPVCSHRNRRYWNVRMDHLNVLCRCRTPFLQHWKHLIPKRFCSSLNSWEAVLQEPLHSR